MIARESERRFRITLPDCETFIPELSVIMDKLFEALNPSPPAASSATS